MSCGISACPAKEVPPCPRPAWFKCPPPKCEPMYLAPEGACIQPITKGGRNGGKKKGACGNCGGENRVPPEVKPNAAPDCPMMKLAAPCAAGSNGKQAEGKNGGIMDKCLSGLKGVFGKSQGSPLLISACKKLAGNSENSDHQDLFDPTLLCNKEGYFSPLFSRVDCQCQDPPVEDECEDFEEDDDDEDEDCDDEEWDEYDYEGELGDEGEGEPEGEEEEAPEACPAQPECPAPCPAPPQCPECIKNTCGECIEEPPECIDPNCKLFLDPKEEDAECEESCKCKEKICDNPCKAFGDDCIAMNNFIIKVQAPRESGKNPNETCEQIIKKLSSNAYPDPEGDRKKKGKKQHPMVVREISVVDPTCECIKPRICNVTEVDVKPPPPPPPCEVPPPPPPPCPEPPSPPCSEPPPPPVRPCPQDCEKKETPPGNGCPPPGQEGPCNLPTEPCTCPYKFTPVPPCPCRIEDEPEPPKCEPPKPPPCCPPPRRGDQNDCEVLSEEELLKMPIKDIMCGAPKPLEGSSESYVWLPPPPPKCARCGAEERGKTEDCYLCEITRFARSPCPKAPEEPISIVDEIQELTKPDNSDCEPVYCADGSMKYKGGMCMELCEKFLNQVTKSSPPGGFFARYLGEAGEIERLKAVSGADNFMAACTELTGCSCNRPSDLKMEYEGDGIENVKHFLWGVKPPDVHEKFERKCIKKEPEPKKPKQCPQPKKGWFG